MEVGSAMSAAFILHLSLHGYEIVRQWPISVKEIVRGSQGSRSLVGEVESWWVR